MAMWQLADAPTESDLSRPVGAALAVFPHHSSLQADEIGRGAHAMLDRHPERRLGA